MSFDHRPVISTKGRNLFVLEELQRHRISPFGRNDRGVLVDTGVVETKLSGSNALGGAGNYIKTFAS